METPRGYDGGLEFGGESIIFVGNSKPTDPDVRDYLIQFLGYNHFNQIRSQTGHGPLGA